jgi:hypothetical protein
MSTTKQRYFQVPDLIEPHTYAELKALVDANNLLPGQKYLLSDYSTQYIQPISNAIKQDAPVEALVLTAFSVNSFLPEVQSPSNPKDYIEYDFNNAILLQGNTQYDIAQTEPIPGIGNNASFGIFINEGGDDELLVNFTLSATDTFDNGTNIIQQRPFFPFKVAVWSDGAYTGSGFNLYINGVTFSVTPEQVTDGGSYPFTGKTIIETVNGNVLVQAYNTTPPTYVPLPDVVTINRPGWITKRIDDNKNEAYFDVRQVLTYGDTTPFQPGFQSNSLYGYVGNGIEDLTPYKKMYLTIGHYAANIAVYTPDGDPYGIGGSNGGFQRARGFGDAMRTYKVYAFGKCDVESYVLINGTPYTIPPFEASEIDLARGSAPPTPIAEITDNIVVQFYIDANNPPTAILPGIIQEPVERVQGELPVFGTNCTGNKIYKMQNNLADIPTVAFVSQCTNNEIGVNNDANYCTLDNSRDNKIKDCTLAIAQFSGLQEEEYNGCNLTIINGGYQNKFTVVNGTLNGVQNDLTQYGGYIGGSKNITHQGLSSFEIYGDENEMGYNSSTGSAYGVIVGSHNKFPQRNFNRPFIRGNFNNGDSDNDCYQTYNLLAGNNNKILGVGSSWVVIGNYNILKGGFGRFYGNYNKITKCVLLGTKLGFDNNELFNVGNTTFGYDCVNNFIFNEDLATHGDNYSNHSPWGELIPRTYTQLTAMVEGNQLIPGAKYLITDYQTKYISPSTGETNVADAVEPIVVTAVSLNTFDLNAVSPSNPTDKIEYKFNLGHVAPGVISPGTINIKIDGNTNGKITGSYSVPTEFGAIFIYNNGGIIGTAQWISGGGGMDVDLSNFTDTGVPYNIYFIGILSAANVMRFKVNGGTPVEFTNIDTYSEFAANPSVPPADGFIAVVDSMHNIRIQAWDNANTQPITDNSLPAPAPPVFYEARTGWITRRIDVNYNETPYDFRTVKFRRWKPDLTNIPLISAQKWVPRGYLVKDDTALYIVGRGGVQTTIDISALTAGVYNPSNPEMNGFHVIITDDSNFSSALITWNPFGTSSKILSRRVKYYTGKKIDFSKGNTFTGTFNLKINGTNYASTDSAINALAFTREEHVIIQCWDTVEPETILPPDLPPATDPQDGTFIPVYSLAQINDYLCTAADSQGNLYFGQSSQFPASVPGILDVEAYIPPNPADFQDFFTFNILDSGLPPGTGLNGAYYNCVIKKTQPTQHADLSDYGIPNNVLKRYDFTDMVDIYIPRGDYDRNTIINSAKLDLDLGINSIFIQSSSLKANSTGHYINSRDSETNNFGAVLVDSGNCFIGYQGEAIIGQSSDVKLDYFQSGDDMIIFKSTGVHVKYTLYGRHIITNSANVTIQGECEEIDIDGSNDIVVETSTNVIIQNGSKGSYIKNKLNVSGVYNGDSPYLDKGIPAAAVAITSTHKIPVTIDGVQYYLLASNV